MPKMIFINLPVKDLALATRFYEAIGCQKNPAFSDERSSSMAWSDTITFQLLTHDFYATWISKPIADAHAASGGLGDIREPQDHGFMYGRTFVDPDGRVFEPMWMDMSAMPTS